MSDVSLDSALLKILRCPGPEHSELVFDEEAEELICESCEVAFPVRDGIPVMLFDEARSLGAN